MQSGALLPEHFQFLELVAAIIPCVCVCVYACVRARVCLVVCVFCLQVYNEYKRQLYLVNKKLFLTKNPDTGVPLREGDPVCPGLKTTKNHKWTDEDYTYKPFKPEPSIAFFQSGIPGANWVNALQVAKKIERQITGREYPFGYRIANTPEEHEQYLKTLHAAEAAQKAASEASSGNANGGGTK